MHLKEVKLNKVSESGFIKFGSRLDIFLPLKTKVNVSINQMVKGGISKIV